MKGNGSKPVETSPIGDIDAAIAAVTEAVEHLRALDFTPADQTHAIALLKKVEGLGTRIDELQTTVAGTFIDAGIHAIDAHTPASFVKHHTRASRTEASARIQCNKAARDLPMVAAAWKNGCISTSIMRRIARTHANPRVRQALIDTEERILEHAERSNYRDFDTIITNWTQLTDEDGTRDRNERNYQNRDASLLQDFDKSWDLSGGYGCLQGAEMSDIFKTCIDIEFRIDWDQAVAIHGDNTTINHLARTDKQRRADALHKIFLAANTGPTGKPAVVTNLVIDHITFARWVRKLAGEDVEADDPWRNSYRCHTIDGTPLEPGEAVTATLLLGEIRRTVIDAKSVVIDLGRKSRLFVGSSRLAAQLGDTHCGWPGCEIPSTDCQIDHSTPWTQGGETNSDNSGPMCGKHNRYKHLGYTSTKQPDGTWTIRRPDGTQLE